VGDQIVVCREPAFGATRHVARVVLAVMSKVPEMRSAMNIRYSPAIIKACEKLDFRMASFDRKMEPENIKEKEGSTLEWGTREAIKMLDHIPDCVYDKGEIGKEPMIRVLGKEPMDVVEKVWKIFQAWKQQENQKNERCRTDSGI
jgi:predicted fused transcriptional regulator/phosphomethylpyrimidine kinase